MNGEGLGTGKRVLLGLGVVVLGLQTLALVALVVREAFDERTPVAASDAAGARIADTSAAEAILESVQVYVRAEDYARAEGVLRQAVTEYIDDQDLRLAYGDFLMDRGRYAESYQQYVAALAIGPRTARMEFTAGTLASLTGQRERALEHYSAAQAEDASNPDYPLYLAQVQRALGMREEAKANLVLASRLDERRAVVWGTLAGIEMDDNRPRLAIQHARRARQLEPRVSVWRLIEARALKRVGEAEQALELLLAIDRPDRDKPEVLRALGESYGMLGKTEDAAALYAEATDRAPQNAQIAFDAAVWADRVGRDGDASRFAQRASDLGHAGAARLLKRLESGVSGAVPGRD